ncbi:MAG: amidohydrolase [Parvularculaceae bacterium]
MKFRTAAAALLALAACSKPGSDKDAADAIYFGGPIYTGLESAPTTEAVAVRDGLIVASGARADIEKTKGAATEMIDLAGAAMFPGFADSHAHLLGIGMRELTLNLEGVGSIEELVEIVGANVEESEPGDVIYGRGWIETGWPEGRFPTRDDLDPASPQNPVILVRADGHALVANSAALALAKIDAATLDPAGGRIERDASGRPTGMLIDNAMALAEGIVGAPGEAQKREAFEVGAGVYAAYGWTSIHNMSVDPNDLALIEDLADQGAIAIRVYNAVDPAGLDALAASGPRASKNGRAITRAVKLYMDGALGSRGAALLAPYADQPETSGLLLMTPEQGAALLASAKNAGIQVSTHAIGDRGNRLTLDWYEAALAGADASALRWRIEHAQIVAPVDIPRFAALGVIASMQPSHAIGDLFFAPARLGPGRLDGAYAWRRLLDSGATIAGGTDAPVERGDPAIEFYAAVARRGLDGTQTADWRSDQKVTRAEALAMFTSAPAYASFRESDLGTIEPGKRADFSVFTKDLMAVPEADILKAKAVMTVVDGEVVYRAAADGGGQTRINGN